MPTPIFALILDKHPNLNLLPIEEKLKHVNDRLRRTWEISEGVSLDR